MMRPVHLLLALTAFLFILALPIIVPTVAVLLVIAIKHI